MKFIPVVVIITIMALYPGDALSDVTYRVLGYSDQWNIAEDKSVYVGDEKCVIYNTYEEKIPMYIALSEKNIALSFYFPKMAVKKNDTLEVALQFDETDIYSGDMTVSNTPFFKFVFNQNYKKQLFQTNSLHLSFADYGYKFNLSDMIRAKNLLEACQNNSVVNEPVLSSNIEDEAEPIVSSIASIQQESSPDNNFTLPQRPVIKNVNEQPLSDDEKELFESMKTKMFLLEQEKQAAKSELRNFRQKEIEVMKADIGSQQKIKQQAERIRILEEKLQKYQYHQINQAPKVDSLDRNINDVVKKSIGTPDQ